MAEESASPLVNDLVFMQFGFDRFSVCMHPYDGNIVTFFAESSSHRMEWNYSGSFSSDVEINDPLYCSSSIMNWWYCVMEGEHVLKYQTGERTWPGHHDPETHSDVFNSLEISEQIKLMIIIPYCILCWLDIVLRRSHFQMSPFLLFRLQLYKVSVRNRLTKCTQMDTIDINRAKDVHFKPKIM